MHAGIINRYPVMHHKLRYYCRGHCFDLDASKAETFSPSTVPRTIRPEPNLCDKCKDYQM